MLSFLYENKRHCCYYYFFLRFTLLHIFKASVESINIFHICIIDHAPCMCSSKENKRSFHTSMLIPLMISFISVSDENYNLALFKLFFYLHNTSISWKNLYSFFLFAPLCYCGKSKLYHSISELVVEVQARGCACYPRIYFIIPVTGCIYYEAN